jgi:phage gpG-like protein
LSIEVSIIGADQLAELMEHASESLRENVHIRLDAACQEIAEYARAIAPRKTGRYAESIYSRSVGECQFVIGAGTEYAATIEFGSAPHFILPRSAKVLKFDVGGETVFAKWVSHPGTAPQMIIHRAKMENYDKIVQAVRDGVVESLQGR